MKNQYLLIDKDTEESMVYANKAEVTDVLRNAGMEAGDIITTFMVFEIDPKVGPVKREINIPGSVGRVSKLTIV